MRHGEAYAVQWKDIDFEAKELHIQRQIQYRESETDENGNSILYFSTPKYNSFRTVQLDDETIALLKRTKEQQEKNREAYDSYYVHYYEEAHTRNLNTVGNGEALYFVNCNADGSFIKPRTMQHASRVIHQELNLPSFDYHSLRHTHCTELLESGVPPKVVQMRLGHKDIRTTLNIYEHITKKMEENKEAQENLQEKREQALHRHLLHRCGILHTVLSFQVDAWGAAPNPGRNLRFLHRPHIALRHAARQYVGFGV